MGEAAATAAARARKIPIVIVPGILGTRLTDPANNKLVWNPLGGVLSDPGEFAANTGRMLRLNDPLEPDTTHIFKDAEKHARVKPIKNFYHLVTSFYGKLARRMHYALARKLAPKNVVPKVFCCGYDFRLSNATSAQRLNTIVTQAQQECDGENVIIIAHSMGGLVSRHFCKNLNGQNRVRALFLLGSPTHGAPKAFKSLREGLPWLDPLKVVVFPLSSSRRFMRGIPAVFELLPTFIYGQSDPAWLQVQRELTGLDPKAPRRTIPVLQFSDGSNVQIALRDIYAGLLDDLAFRQSSDQHLIAAFQFHNGLLAAGSSTEAYMHPNTINAFCDDLDTPGKFKMFGNPASVTPVGPDMVVQTTRIAVTIDVKGDETVPGRSGDPTRVRPPVQESFPFQAVKHDALSVDEGVMQFLINRIDRFF